MRAKRKVAIYCERPILDEEVVRVLIDHEYFDPICFESSEELKREVFQGDFICSVIGLSRINMRSIRFLPSPRIVLCKDKKSHELWPQDEGQLFVFPDELRLLPASIEKLAGQEVAKSRKQSRRPVNWLTSFRHGSLSGNFKMVDISAGGAGGFINDHQLSPGDQIEILIPSDSTSEENWVPAEVIWDQQKEVPCKKLKESGALYSIEQRLGLAFAA